MQLSFAAEGQSLTISKKSAPLVEIFKDIKIQTGYDFIYQVDLFKTAKPVDINVVNKSVKEVLDRCFADQPFTYRLESKTVVVLAKTKIPMPENAKQVVFRGKIVDSVGNGLPGATVKNVRTNIATTTDNNGNFSLFANVGDQISINFIGYNSAMYTVPAETGKVVVITLSFSIRALQEVVVTSGYQTIKKDLATGSFQHIGEDILSKRPVSDLSTVLQGVATGVQAKQNADGTMNILIRGAGTMYAGTGPLVVVDGFPIQNAAGTNADFSSINPNDVESIDILKDAAAAAIWGARSANGVIVITTKKGKGKNGLTIDGSVFTRISEKTDLNQYLATASSADMIRYEKLAAQNNLYFATNVYTGGASFPLDQSLPLTLAQRAIYANRYGQLSTGAMNTTLDSLSLINNRSQIQDLLMRRAIVNQYNVNFSANTERSKTYSSLLFENNQTRYQGTGNQRYSINLSNEYKVAKFLTFNFGMFVQYNAQKNSGATNAEIQSLSPYETLLNPNGLYSINVGTRNDYALSLLPLSRFPYPDWNYNLLRETRARDLDTKSYLARIQTGFVAKLLPGLTFNTSLQYERGRIDVNNYYSDDTYYVRNMVNQYVQYNNTTKTVGTVYLPKGGINQYSNTNSANYLFRNQFSYDKLIGKHRISASAGTEITNNRTDLRTDPWQYGYNPATLQSTVPQYGYGSAVDQYYQFTSVNPGATLSGGNTTLSYSLNRYVSLYSLASYTYDDKYTLSASARSDASNYITKDPSLRWSPFWTIGGSWNAKNEAFAQRIGWLDRLILRATYGSTGNTVTSSSTSTLLSVGSAPDVTTGTITASIADNGNPTLRWERTVSTNIGLDYSMFNGRLFGTVEVYNKQGKDITGIIKLASTTGTNQQRFNNAEISNRGIELELGSRGNIGATGLSYNTSLQYSYNRNRITSLFFPQRLANAMRDPATTYIEGMPLNAVYSFVYSGMQNGVPTIIGPNGTSVNIALISNYMTSPGEQFMVYQGTTTPPTILSYRASLGYKNFNLTAFFTGNLGGVYRNPTFNYATAWSGSTKTQVNRWVADVFAGSTSVPGFPMQNSNDFYLWSTSYPILNTLTESSSYIQCSNVMLDYSLPKDLIRKAGLRNVRVFLQGTDLGMIYVANRNKYNPDYLPGTERPLRSYTIGANIGF
ncbi:SusC/RagA family TonB-linked outer membrane protein [Pedobacter jeongneungensis]|uniref:SusC/RagA family TonB-linked outer membrane protein n=1 Tax=Pedobacter jeongneungensis TaxID=947309 RepID=UPI00046AC8A0|nr:SusC/RagA family TonB-linked outer membrane protein [Pedobacter jeongneungensis]